VLLLAGRCRAATFVTACLTVFRYENNLAIYDYSNVALYHTLIRLYRPAATTLAKNGARRINHVITVALPCRIKDQTIQNLGRAVPAHGI